MSQENFTVANVKCGGCVSIIQNGLGEMPGVREVTVDIATGAVSVSGEALDHGALAEKLAQLGYPEKAD